MDTFWFHGAAFRVPTLIIEPICRYNSFLCTFYCLHVLLDKMLHAAPDFPFISISGSRTFDRATLMRKTQRATLHNTLKGSMPIHNNLQLFKHRAYHSWQLVFRNPAGFHVKTWHSLPTALHKTEVFLGFITFVGGFHLKSAGFQNMSFCVMIKYRSFFRKTKY